MFSVTVATLVHNGPDCAVGYTLGECVFFSYTCGLWYKTEESLLHFCQNNDCHTSSSFCVTSVYKSMTD